MLNKLTVVTSNDVFNTVREFDSFDDAMEWIGILIKNKCEFSISYRAR